MATLNNTDSPFGFKPARMLDSTPYNGAVLRAHLPASYETATFIGDAVVPTGTASRSNGDRSVMEVNEAGTNDALLGAVSYYEPDPDDIQTIYRKADTARYAGVVPGLNVVFIGRTDAAIAATDIGDNVDIVVTHDGNTTTGLSGHEVDATGAGGAAQLQLLGYLPHVDAEDDYTPTNPIAEVRVNEQELGSDSAGT